MLEVLGLLEAAVFNIAVIVGEIVLLVIVKINYSSVQLCSHFFRYWYEDENNSMFSFYIELITDNFPGWTARKAADYTRGRGETDSGRRIIALYHNYIIYVYMHICIYIASLFYYITIYHIAVLLFALLPCQVLLIFKKY